MAGSAVHPVKQRVKPRLRDLAVQIMVQVAARYLVIQRAGGVYYADKYR